MPMANPVDSQGSCSSFSAVRGSPALRDPLLRRTGGWRPAEGVANYRPGGEHGECSRQYPSEHPVPLDG